jgi:hypothetical protein
MSPEIREHLTVVIHHTDKAWATDSQPSDFIQEFATTVTDGQYAA